MKKKKIYLKITDNYNEISEIFEYCLYDELNNIITYMENDVDVSIIIKDNIKIIRKSNNYKLELVFDNRMTNSIYEIYNPLMTIEVEVDTLVLKKDNKGFYIEYLLIMNNENIGIYKIECKMEDI